MSPRRATSFDPAHWKDPDKFDPDRYNSVPTCHQIDEAKCEQIGFAKCPFDRTKFDVTDGRKATMHNSGFGTVYGIVNDKPLPVCDYAGFAPFGFGYRRCPGEQLTIDLIIWDTGDQYYDSSVIIDNWQWKPSPVKVGTQPN